MVSIYTKDTDRFTFDLKIWNRCGREGRKLTLNDYLVLNHAFGPSLRNDTGKIVEIEKLKIQNKCRVRTAGCIHRDASC